MNRVAPARHNRLPAARPGEKRPVVKSPRNLPEGTGPSGQAWKDMRGKTWRESDMAQKGMARKDMLD